MDFVLNNLLLIGVAFGSGAMLLWPVVFRGAGGPWVNTLEATRLMNSADGLVVDVREPPAFSQGHVLGARNLPLSKIGTAIGEFSKFKKRPVIVHCEDGRRAGKALIALKAAGFEKVSNLSGGFSAWKQAGLPVEK